MAICMAFLKLLLSSGLIFVATAAFIEENAKGETAVIPCFSDYVIPVNHNVELTLFVEKSSNGYCYAPFHLEAQQNDNNFALYGKSTVVVNITRPMRHIKLRLQQPQINGLIFVMNNKQKFQNGKIQKYSYDYDTQSYDLYFQSELLEGLYTIETDFVGGLNDIVGLSVFSYSNSEQERWIVAINDLQKIVAQLIFPCLDRSELKLNLTITIRHYIYNLVSNLKETKYTSENGIKSWQYHITSMTRNYLVFIVLKDFISVTHMEHKDIQIWYRKDLQWHIDYMWDIIYDVFKYLENKWLIKCSSPTMHIIIPNIKDGIMSPGLIFYR
ncbi:endoplasmic reticulum aminopeptidase 1-like [Polyergus mexicanus]|uniref:endoplasmic reticulum aminopeptidase 1-like n=1 Tax=Polyergus mexicanus TaxID=615972 RepID=UPI0038B5B6EE